MRPGPPGSVDTVRGALAEPLVKRTVMVCDPAEHMSILAPVIHMLVPLPDALTVYQPEESVELSMLMLTKFAYGPVQVRDNPEL